MAPPGPALAAGLLFFPGLFLLARSALRRRCPEPHAVILAARLVSSVQAVMASTAGIIIASSCQHVIDDQHWLAKAYPAFAVPYFLYDVYAMFLCHRHRACVKGHETAPPPRLRAAAVAFLRREPLLVLHHVTMVLVCFPVACLWRQGKGDFFLGCLLLAELSTPCVCLGKVLILLGRQHTALHRLNGLTLLVTFLLCRVLLFPYLYWAYGRQRGLPLLRVPGALPPGTNAAAAALLAPQLYWFGLICRGAWRLLRTSTPRPTGGAVEGGTPRPTGGAVEGHRERAIEGPVEGDTARPLGGAIEGDTARPTGGAIEGDTARPTGGAIEGCIDSPIAKPIESPIEGAIGSPIESPIEGAIESPTASPIAGTIESPIESPIVGPIESPIVRPTLGPIESPRARPMESPIMGPIESPKVGPIESPIARPIESPIMGPIASPLVGPIESPTESPGPQRHPP